MNKMLFAAVLGTAILGSGAAAQPVPPAPAMPPMARGQMGGRMQGDRTRAQAQQMADQMFQRFDLNGDGVLTRDEAQQALAQAEAARGGDEAGQGGGEQGGGRAARMIDRMFAGAPSVTIQQFEAQALARFDRQDVNHDGVVTSDERRQGWGERPQ